MTKKEPIVVENDKKHHHKKRITPAVMFIIVAVTLAVGYVIGTYHYQIRAAIGPIFGYNAHSGSIDLSSLEKTYNELAANYDGTLDVEALITGANSGLVAAAGDTYTVYMNSKDTTSYNNGLEGNIGGGIGAVIGIKKSQITIMDVLANNPAIKAGLLANDVVAKINDQDTAGWTVEQAVSQIRGAEGTTVKLSILRGDSSKDYTVTRAIINNPSVISSITDGVGLMEISRFDEQTGTLARAAAQEFKSKGVESVILDLRNNPGGYVSAAVDVAGLWLDNKIVVTERNGEVVKETLRSGNNAILSGIPTIILINSGTASASEIVAGALQDHAAARIVGEVSFGKGSVQELIALDNGAQLKVTVARWYTPNGKTINQNGIVPDVAIGLSQTDVDNGVDPQINEAVRLLAL
jgi:carboxyl-terminal processing protease